MYSTTRLFTKHQKQFSFRNIAAELCVCNIAYAQCTAHMCERLARSQANAQKADVNKQTKKKKLYLKNTSLSFQNALELRIGPRWSCLTTCKMEFVYLDAKCFSTFTLSPSDTASISLSLSLPVYSTMRNCVVDISIHPSAAAACCPLMKSLMKLHLS